MPQFNTSLFLEQAGRGDNPIAALQIAYGMPACMLNLTSRLLSLLPSSVLGSVRGSAANGANRADDVIRATLRKLGISSGFMEFETEDGSIQYVSNSSEDGMDANEANKFGALSDFLSILGAGAGFAGGIYANYQAVAQDIEYIKDCLGGFRTWLKFTSNGAAEEADRFRGMTQAEYEQYLRDQYGIIVADVRRAAEVRDSAYALVDEIDAILAARALDPGLEPLFNGEFAEFASSLNVEPPPPPEPKEVIRLSYGPPRSRKGKFLLSVDGLYYDSQTDGIAPVLLEIDNRLNSSSTPTDSLWRMEQDPNLGGKGKQFSLQDFETYVNTILDPNNIDESESLQPYYSADILLKDLDGQKKRKAYDVSAQIASFQASGASQLLIANLKQVLISEISHFNQKINKRKKQIELAVKMPVIYGKPSRARRGKIPINDFSFLEGINYMVDIEKQKKLSFNQGEVSSVVLPIETRYVQPIQNYDTASLNHLLIANLGIGQLISTSVSGTSGATLRVTDSVVTDGLLALYNYISFDVESPSSNNFSLFNSSKVGTELNGMLVAESTRELLKSGIGIPFLKGITDYSESSGNPKMGSYVRLPDAPALQDLLYNKSGATIDTWVNVPNLTVSSGYNQEVSGLYRLILANENTGIVDGAQKYDNILAMPYDNGSKFTHGIVMGFTRDRRITSDALPSNSESDNPASATCFFIAPTQSFDSSSVGFISKSLDDSGNCYAQDGWFNMKVPVTQVTSGVSFSSCSNNFCHVAVSFDPTLNQISIYLDGQVMATSSYESVFGSYYSRVKSLNYPTFKRDNSFEYTSSSMSYTTSNNLKAGPRLGTFFTPYILGGGFTDGIQGNGFMGGEYGGITSGLKGYLGCTKIYSKALDSGAILTNFRANRDFFKNVEIEPLA